MGGLTRLTQIGDTFAGRVAASLLTAIGLPELITTTPQSYEELAVDLAFDREKSGAIRARLSKNRLSKTLFDTQLFTKHIEAGYTITYDRLRENRPPDHIYIARQESQRIFSLTSEMDKCRFRRN